MVSKSYVLIYLCPKKEGLCLLKSLPAGMRKLPEAHLSLLPLSKWTFHALWLGLGYVLIFKLITDKSHGIGMIAIGSGS